MPDFRCRICNHVHYEYPMPPPFCAHCGDWHGMVGLKPEKKKPGCGEAAVFLLAVFVVLSASVVAVLAAVF